MTKEYDIIATAVSADQLFQIKLMKIANTNSRVQFFEINNILLQDLPGTALINVCRIMVTGEPPIIEYAIQYNGVFTPANLLADMYKSHTFIKSKGSVSSYASGLRLTFVEDTTPIKTEESIEDGMNKLDESFNLEVESPEKEKSIKVSADRAMINDRPVYIKLSGYVDDLKKEKKTCYFQVKDVRNFKQVGNIITVSTVPEAGHLVLIAVFYPTERSASIALSKFIESLGIQIL